MLTIYPRAASRVKSLQSQFVNVLPLTISPMTSDIYIEIEDGLRIGNYKNLEESSVCNGSIKNGSMFSCQFIFGCVMAGDRDWNSRIINGTEKSIVDAICRPKYSCVRSGRQSVTDITEVETIFAFVSQKKPSGCSVIDRLRVSVRPKQTRKPFKTDRKWILKIYFLFGV